MKLLSLLFTICFACQLQAQDSPIVSNVYSWDSTQTDSRNLTKTPIFSGSGAILSRHSMFAVTIPANKQMILAPSSMEKFFIVKNGPAKVTMGDSTRVLYRGSVVSVMPGDKVVMQAVGAAAQLYEMDYTSIAAVDAARGRKAGGSFMLDWNNIAFKPHDKGGVRQFFDRQTAMLNRFDIHVTTLNPNNKSHDPHTHKNEEIILMLQGNAEMQIGTAHQKANANDAVYLGSMVLHNLTNIGTVPCIYFAIQWN